MEEALRDLDADLRRLADGDRSVFGRVFGALWPVLRAYCARALGDGPDAEDCAQNSLVKLFAQVGEYDPSRPGLPWALAIAAWECKTVKRRRSRSRTAPAEAGELAPSDELSPEQQAEDRELVRAARDVLESLSAPDRQTLQLALGAAFEARPASPTLRKRKERALSRLRDAFRRLYGSS